MDRILFADDEKNLRETFYDYFTAHGFSVTLAADYVRHLFTNPLLTTTGLAGTKMLMLCASEA